MTSFFGARHGFTDYLLELAFVPDTCEVTGFVRLTEPEDDSYVAVLLAGVKCYDKIKQIFSALTFFALPRRS